MYRRKETKRPENTESSAGWLKRKDQPRNEKGGFTNPEKSAGKPMDLALSLVSDDDDFQCYNTSEGKSVHTNVDDELQLLPKETNLTPESGIKTNLPSDEPHQTVKKSKRIPNAKQTEKLGGIPYYTNNNKKKINKNCVLQGSQTGQPNQSHNEEETNREIWRTNRKIRTTIEDQSLNRLFWSYQPKQSPTTESTRRRGNVECRGQTISHKLNYHRQRVA